VIISKKQRRLRRAVKARSHIRNLATARLSVHRTPNHIYAQITDADGAKVIAAASTLQKARGPEEHRQRRGRQGRRTRHRRAQ
jgi:ribosomal protein L18